MTKLTGGTVVQNPQTLEPVFLAAGSDLPEWAEGLVGDHLLDQPAKQDGQPAGNASLEDWQEFARSEGATDADLDGMNRNALRDQYGK